MDLVQLIYKFVGDVNSNCIIYYTQRLLYITEDYVALALILIHSRVMI